MWLFGKHGHLSLGQHTSDSNYLVVQSQLREEADKFAALLHEVSGERHDVQEIKDGNYKFAVLASRALVAQAVARLVTEIDHERFVHSVHFDFGAVQPGFLLWLNQTGLQVARVRQ